MCLPHGLPDPGELRGKGQETGKASIYNTAEATFFLVSADLHLRHRDNTPEKVLTVYDSFLRCV